MKNINWPLVWETELFNVQQSWQAVVLVSKLLYHKVCHSAGLKLFPVDKFKNSKTPNMLIKLFMLMVSAPNRIQFVWHPKPLSSWPYPECGVPSCRKIRWQQRPGKRQETWTRLPHPPSVSRGNSCHLGWGLRTQWILITIIMKG